MTALVVITAIVIVLALLRRWLSLLLYPDTSCWWCKGKGTRWGSNRKRSGPCWFCKGKPKRKRRG